MTQNPHPRNLVWLLVCVALSSSVGCASSTPRTSATWLAAAAHGVKDKAVKYKEQRDALSKARQMSINSLEQSAASLEATTHTTTAFWASGPSKELFDKIVAESEATEQRQQEWARMRQEHEQKVAAAMSSVASVGDKLGETTKRLAALGSESKFKDQLQFYVGFASEVNSSLKKLEEEARKKQEEGSAEAQSKDTQAKAEVSAVNQNAAP